LTNGVRYYFRVLAHNAAGWGLASTVVNAVPHTVPPSAPRSPTATPGDRAVAVTWLAPATNGGVAIDKYAVQRSTSPTTGWVNIAFPAATATKYVATTGMVNGTRYYFRILAHNARGWSPPSAVVSATPVGKPGFPTNLTATPGAQQAILGWQPPASDGGESIDAYIVRRYTADCASKIDEREVAAPPYVWAGLGDGRSWCFTVTARNGVGEGPPSNAARVMVGRPTAPAPCSAEVQLVIEDGVVRRTVLVRWSRPASDGGYRLTGYEVTLYFSGFPGIPQATVSFQPDELFLRIRSVLERGTWEFVIEPYNDDGGPGPACVAFVDY
jgi:titin